MTMWKRVFRGARYLPATIVFVAICYFALKPYPSIAQVPGMPSWLGRWLDGHDFLVNVGGYLVLTAVMHATFTGWRRVGMEALWWRTLWLGGLVIALEIGQIYIPRRNFDLQDIFAGLLGVGLATAMWFRPQPRAGPPDEVLALTPVDE